jgi:ABC-type nitrate/sulfonate/bicarbonate transport system permease component
MLGGNQGLGILLIRSMKSFEVARMFATIVVIVALSLAVYGMIQGLANLIMPWNKQKQTR